MKKLLVSVFSFLLCLSIINAKEVSLNSKRYILYNLNENKVIDSNREHERISIASLTKMMTVIVSIEKVKDLDKKITITSQMVDSIPWDVMKFGFKKGDVVTYRDLLYAAILPSAADAIYGLEISISGSEKAFVKLMNDKVKELGLKDTKFANGVGLYDDNNYSSAYDVAQILEYGLKNETFKKVFTTKKYKMTNGKTLNSTLYYYGKKIDEDISFIRGSKTGFIDESGYCLASISSINGVDYLFVSLNANKTPQHIEDHIKEYKYFSKNYSYKEIVNPEDKMLTLSTKYAKEKSIDIYANVYKKVYLKNDFKKEDLVFEYNGIKEQTYFNKKKLLGHMTIKYNDKVLDEFDLFNDTKLHFDIIDYLKSNKKILAIIICSLLGFIVLIVLMIKKILNLKVDIKKIKSYNRNRS